VPTFPSPATYPSEPVSPDACFPSLTTYPSAATYPTTVSATAGTFPSSVPVVVVTEPRPGPLTVVVTTADGAEYRFSGDEPDPAWVPFAISWESTVPGGWKGASFSLLRRIDDDVPLRLYDEVEILDEHGQTLYEGRIVKLPRQHGDDFLLNVECLGWASHLLDDKSFREVYVDRDMSHWHEAPLWRRSALALAGNPQGRIPVNTSAGGIVFDVPNEALTQFERTELWYEAPAGVAIALVGYIGERNGAFTNLDAATVNATDQPEGAAPIESYSLSLTGTVQVQALTTARRRVFLLVRVNTAVTPAAGHQERYTTFAVYGDHGLPTASIFADTYGFYIDDMLADAIGRAAPKLNFTTGDGGSIERPPLIVPQACYVDPGPVENVLLDLNKYVIWDWLVYENKTFFYRPTDPDRLTWEARLDRGIHLSLEGDDAEHAYNGAMVRYSTPGQEPKVAGPTGSGLDVESDLLLDEDTENTVNQHGYQRRWIELDISFPTLDDYAVTIGAAYLAQSSLPSRSGDITLRGDVEHPTKGFRPAREIRAGDWIRLSDHPADVPRRIISCRHSDDAAETVVSVGNDLNKVDAMLEQLGVKTKVTLG
jgi:hypothetical protein